MSPEKIQNQELQKENAAIAIGEELLAKEDEAVMEPKRKYGYMMATALAMFLTVGAVKTEAQVRGVGPQSWGGDSGRGLLGEVIGRGSFGARSALDRNESKKRASIEQEYLSNLEVIRNAEKEMERQWNEKRSAAKGNPVKLQEMNAEYEMEKAEFAKTKTDLRIKYEKEMRKAKAKGDLINRLFAGTTGGW
jgi:hypothetical protein